jgi:hypothetical protein
VFVFAPAEGCVSTGLNAWGTVTPHSQVAPDLHSCSLSTEDLDNFFAHSCDPNLSGYIRADYAVELTSVRDIAAGEALTIDYEMFEDDMAAKGVDFDCKCKAPGCRLRVVRLFECFATPEKDVHISHLAAVDTEATLVGASCVKRQRQRQSEKNP